MLKLNKIHLEDFIANGRELNSKIKTLILKTQGKLISVNYIGNLEMLEEKKEEYRFENENSSD